MKDATVAIFCGPGDYSLMPPFNPYSEYEEYPFDAARHEGSNNAYDAVRQALRLLRVDTGHFGKGTWNPLGLLISPGDTVVIKPNLIRESHIVRESEWEQIITHGSIIRAVIDYAYIALKGKGRIIVADGPQTDSDFHSICERAGLNQIVEFYRSNRFEIQVMDLRRDRWFQRGDVIYKRAELPGDPKGYTEVDLGEGSEFSTYSLSGRFYGADYEMDETRRFHSKGHHAYVLCRTVMDADVIINLPKMKTHKKAGVTLSLKNMVGINGYRNCLPHHTLGTPDVGGDEFPSAHISSKLQSQLIVGFKKLLTVMGGKGGAWARVLKRLGRGVFGDTNEVVRSGNWYGNDTIWRTVLDLNKALFYFGGDGKRRSRPLRYLTIVDGIIAGEGDGPVAADRKDAGIVVAGFNPVAVDTVASVLMGFDYRKIPMLDRAWKIKDFPLVSFETGGIECLSNVREWTGSLEELICAGHLNFRPHFGWLGHMERDRALGV